jgi:hypothetical protein
VDVREVFPLWVHDAKLAVHGLLRLSDSRTLLIRQRDSVREIRMNAKVVDLIGIPEI